MGVVYSLKCGTVLALLVYLGCCFCAVFVLETQEVIDGNIEEYRELDKKACGDFSIVSLPIANSHITDTRKLAELDLG